MKNLFAITLVLISLVWSPSPHHEEDEVIVKDGHRTVVVEYDKHPSATTKVSISPYDVVLNDEKPAQQQTFASGASNLVCDAYGKCKGKLANVVGKTKHMATKTAEKAKEIEQHAKEAIEKAQQDLGEAKEKLSEVSIKVPGHTIGTVAGGVSKVKEVAADVTSTVKDGVSKVKNFDIVNSPKRIGEDISRNVTGEHVKEQAKEKVKNVHEIVKKGSNDIFSKVKEVTYDVWYVLHRDRMGSVVGLIHMLGFSTAYGMCVWVTFVSSYVLGRCLPVEMFGMVQSKIYPVYFKALAYCVCAALLGDLMGQRGEILGSKMGMFQRLSLVSALFMVLTNMIILEPKAAKAMNKRMMLEKEEGRGVGVAVAAAAAVKDRMVESGGVRSGANRKGVGVPKEGMVCDGNGEATVVRSVVVERRDIFRLKEKLKRLNAYSSALNLFTLVALTWHMAYMGQRLQATW